MRRLIIAGFLFICASADDVEAADKVARIGWLHTGSAATYAPMLAAFLSGLSDFGFVEGQNFVVEYRWADGQIDRLPKFAAELVGSGVDLIVAGTIPAARAARQATTTIPIVMAGAGDPVGQGVASSLARPSGNLTGTSNQDEDLMPKRLELLVTVAPAARRIAVLVNPLHPLHPKFLEVMSATAQTIGVALVPIQVHGPEGLPEAFAAVRRANVGAIAVLPDAPSDAVKSQIVALVNQARLPAIYSVRSWVAIGGLMSYGSDLPSLYRRSGEFAARILNGAKPADLPVEQPTKFELAINLKTAKALGIEIPPSLLARADEVIE
jgi:putative ABC transport system substrate-binding protein